MRIVSINIKENRVVLYRYDIFSKEAIEYDIAPHYFTPLFKIGEVAKMLNRSAETIRKYENKKLIPKAQQYNLSIKSKAYVRLYKELDIYELAEFFANRNPVGRPSATNKVSKINQKELHEFINSRFQRVKKSV